MEPQSPSSDNEDASQLQRLPREKNENAVLETRIEEKKKARLDFEEAQKKAAEAAAEAAKKAAKEKTAWEDEKEAFLAVYDAAKEAAAQERAQVAKRAEEEKRAWEAKIEEEKKQAVLEFQETQKKLIAAEAAKKSQEEKTVEKGREQNTVNEDRPQSRNLQAQLEAQWGEVRRLEGLLVDEENRYDRLVMKNEKLEEKYRLMKRELGIGGELGDGGEYKARLEQRLLEVEVLRRRLEERDETMSLAEIRIAEKNRTILYLKNYLREHGYQVDETIPLAETRVATEKTDPEKSREEKEKGKSAADEQLIAQNASLKTRVSELEVINELLRGRIAQLEQDEQNTRNGEEMRRDSEETQRALIREIDGIIVAVTKGDLSQKIAIQPVEMYSDIAGLKRSINGMVDQLQVIFHEVSHVAREVGKEGTLGGQARVPNASGIWKEMVECVNEMVRILTLQVRSISSSIQAIGQGDFSRKVQVESQGETLVLKDTINHVIDSLMVVVTDVIKLGKDTALEGALGGQADVDQLHGMWKTMVDYTNSMAYILTAQTRSISDIAIRVSHGDPTFTDMDPLGRGELHATHMAIKAMLDDLKHNWTRGAGEVGKEGRDKQVEQERLQRIWTILHGNI